MYLRSYKELIVWQKSIKLVKEIYKLTYEFPKSEIYGLSSQMQRAAISIPSNIAEGYSRKNLKEYIQFLHIAYGSSAELETQLIIVKELYPKLGCNTAESFLEEIRKMLNTIIKKLENNN
ncbi:MAG: four helix bundle protein [Candidatus Staskawiczbacteria bacterium]|nr:four helix bundle protein [Candidatus Staskawiczbacteria bacterium]MBI3337434.1 four helix bundle protein [Candidatus Staskawiczbacteria bacterium]